MKDWIVTVHEEYTTTYAVKAETQEEAEDIAEQMNIEQLPCIDGRCDDRTCEARLADEGDQP